MGNNKKDILTLKPLLIGVCLAGLLWLGSGCGGGSRFVAPDAPPNDRRPVPSPQSREINLAADNVDKLGTMQVQRLFDLSRHARNIAGDPKPAMNIDAFDEVHNSSWFNNRNGQKPLTLKALAQGVTGRTALIPAVSGPSSAPKPRG